MPYLLENQRIAPPVPDMNRPLRKRMGMNIIKINTDNLILPVAKDEFLPAIHEAAEEAVGQPVIAMGKLGITLASQFVGGIEPHRGIVGVKQCPLIGKRVFLDAVRQV